MELVRQRAQGFGQQAQLGAVNGELAGLGLEEFTFRAEDIPEVPLLKLLVVDAFRQVVTGDVELNTAANVLQGDEGCLAHDTAGHHTTGHAHFDVQRVQLVVLFRIKLGVQRIGSAVTTEVVRKRNALLTQLRQLLAAGF